MKTAELIAGLQAASRRLAEEGTAHVDAQTLIAALDDAASALAELDRKAQMATALLAHFRDELHKQAIATARLQRRNPALLARLVNACGDDVAALIALKGEINREYDAAFSATLRSCNDHITNTAHK